MAISGKKLFITGVHALTGWALCGSIIGIGRSLLTMQTTLIVHAMAVPVIFGIISIVYFKKFNYTSPLVTAVIFVGTAAFLDFFVVALFIEKSFVMFKSVLGTWIPFILIFLITYLIGRAIRSLKKDH